MRIYWKYQQHIIKNQILLLNCLLIAYLLDQRQKYCLYKTSELFFSQFFLIIGLCNSFANSLLEIILFLTIPINVFYQKLYWPLKQVHVDNHHILDF